MTVLGCCRASARWVPVLVLGCAEPSFVSLGRNLTAVQRDDAGASVPSTPDAAAGEPALYPGLPGMHDPCIPSGPITPVTTDCEARSLIECPAPIAGDPDALAAALRALMVECNAWDSVLSVRFEGGCATSYDLSVAVLPEAPTCIQARLGAVRYACAESVACAAGLNFAPIVN